MAFNNGGRVTIFGKTFKEHDGRSMQRILTHYNQLPSRLDHTTLFKTLVSVAKTINHNEGQILTNWLANGGEFPFGQAPPPVLDTSVFNTSNNMQVDMSSRGTRYWGTPHVLGNMAGPSGPSASTTMPPPSFETSFNPSGLGPGPYASTALPPAGFASSSIPSGIGSSLNASNTMPEFPTPFNPSEFDPGYHEHRQSSYLPAANPGFDTQMGTYGAPGSMPFGYQLPYMPQNPGNTPNFYPQPAPMFPPQHQPHFYQSNLSYAMPSTIPSIVPSTIECQVCFETKAPYEFLEGKFFLVQFY